MTTGFIPSHTTCPICGKRPTPECLLCLGHTAIPFQRILEEITTERQTRQLSQDDAADHFNLSRQTINALENGRTLLSTSFAQRRAAGRLLVHYLKWLQTPYIQRQLQLLLQSPPASSETALEQTLAVGSRQSDLPAVQGPKRPVHSEQRGKVRAVVWANTLPSGDVGYTATFTKIFQHRDGSWSDRCTLFPSDLPYLTLVTEALTAWFEQKNAGQK